MAIRLATTPPAPVPFHRDAKFSRKGNGNSVIRQSILDKKQLYAGTTDPFPFAKHFPYHVPPL
jgi:hypothetical protein